MGKKIVVRGSGIFLNPFITELMKAVPDARVFDQTDQFQAAVAQEQKLVDLGYVDRSSIPKNGKVHDPAPSGNPDLVVSFDGLAVEIRAGGESERLLCPKLESMRSMDEFNAFLAGLVAKARRLLT